jgi:spermidine/putrescine transport system ATP-binding protein
MNDKPLLQLEAISKRFGATEALAHIDLTLTGGEFLTLLGPSGCGKTTLLRIIAGFEQPNTGHVTLAGRDITRQAPHKRPVNTVFQRYLLFPHLSVAENVAFGLRFDRCTKAESARRAREALALVRLSDYANRRPDQLSGGQAQRVSLARALVKRPQLLLLDEPLSSLDLKIRLDMQAELRRIHREIGTTFLYVTHDQQEAMSMSDRVAVMSAGRIEQIGAPTDVYHRPSTSFVAQFVGDANLIPVELVSQNGSLTRVRLTDGSAIELDIAAEQCPCNGNLVLRPELMRLGPPNLGGLRATVVDAAFTGSSVLYRVRMGNTDLRIHELGSDLRPSYDIGSQVSLAYDPTRPIVLTE